MSKGRISPLSSNAVYQNIIELIEDIDSERFDIIAFDEYIQNNELENSLSDVININNATYELRCITVMKYTDEEKSHAEIFSCHNKWSYQNYNDSICTQSLAQPRLKRSAQITFSININIPDVILVEHHIYFFHSQNTTNCFNR